MPLLDEDIRRLAAATGRPAADFVDEVDGWRLLKGAGAPGAGCVFLGTLRARAATFRGCTVHADRPEACRTYPFVLDEDGRVRRESLVCPRSGEFPAPAGIADRLLRLARNLEDERAARAAP